MNLIIKLATKISTRQRNKRYAPLKSLLTSSPHRFKIIDAGGTQAFWDSIGLTQKNFEIVLINIYKADVSHPNFTSLQGDATDLSDFEDDYFDIAFSNSVIEHVGDIEQQRRMANELERVGKRLWIQTPNRYFPIEPHFFFPFFQFLPLRLRLFIAKRLDFGWFKIIRNQNEKSEFVSSLRLLTLRELKELFPKAIIVREKFLGLTKSFIVADDWGPITTMNKD